MASTLEKSIIVSDFEFQNLEIDVPPTSKKATALESKRKKRNKSAGSSS